MNMKTQIHTLIRAISVTAILLVGTATSVFADADQLQEDIKKLASDEYMGRRPGTDGIEKAAKLIEDRFISLGLQTVGGSYRQTFSAIENLEITDNNSASISMIVPRRGIPKERLKPVAREMKLGKDFTPFLYSGNGTAEGDLAFLGFGISNPMAGYDDYEGIDATGKIAVILTGTPEGEVSADNYQGLSDPFYKIENAQRHGAAGVILLGMKGDSANVLPTMAYMEILGKPDIPVIFAQRVFVEKFFPNSHSLITLEEKIMAEQKPHSMVLEDRSTKIQVELKDKIIETSNIIGLVEGTEEPEEYIIIGAHYDHLGTNALNSMQKSSHGHIHNGADDNASGTALMLQLADVISKSPLQKSVLFVAFSSEEMGLLGSKHFVENALIDLEQVDIMINMDMVGMLKNELNVYGTGTGLGLEELVNEAAAQADIQTKNIKLPHGPSDHLMFFRQDVPVLHLFTGLHPHFHRPSDDAENLNFEGIQKIGEFVYALVSGISFSDVNFVEVKAQEDEQFLFGELPLGPQPKPMGIYSAFHFNSEGLELLEVVRESRAWKAGLRPGDVITKVNGRKVSSTTSFRYNIMDIASQMTSERVQAGIPLNLEILRDGETRKVTVEI